MLESNNKEKIQLDVILTNLCNNECNYCFVYGSPKGNSFLSFEDYLKVFNFKEYNVILLYGGEPFRHPELPQFYEHAKEQTRKVRIITNGSIIQLIKDRTGNLDLDSSIEKTIERISEYDHSGTKIKLSVNKETMKNDPNMDKPTILNNSLRYAQAAFDIGYYKDEIGYMHQTKEALIQKGIDPIQISTRVFVALGRGEAIESKCFSFDLNLPSISDFLAPSGKIFRNYQQIANEMKRLSKLDLQQQNTGFLNLVQTH